MKKGSLKNGVMLGALMFSAGGMAAELEVSMFYPADMTTRNDVDVASEVVGFYHNLEWANALMAEKGANLTLKPTKVSALTGGEFDDATTGVIELLNDMTTGSSVASTDAGHIAVGIANIENTKYGYSQAFVYNDYQLPTLGTRKTTITHGISMSINSQEANSRILLHEALHTLGASHGAGDAALFDTTENYGYGTICDNSLGSIMDDNPSGTLDEMSISGAVDCTGDNTANMINFINKYAPMKATHVTPTDNQTVTLAVTENTSDETFEFVATRDDTASAETMTLYVAGGKGYNANANSLMPMDVEFPFGSTTSTPITVDFADIHPMFEQAHASYQSTYAVVIGTDEVQDALVDLLDINTQWTYDDSGDTNEDADSNGGGSLGFVAVIFLALMSWRRRT